HRVSLQLASISVHFDLTLHRSTMPQTLPDDLLEEVFLRLPPGEPEHLLRASLASKLWLSLLASARFRGRYGDRHGAPPMLGFLYSWPEYAGPEDEEHKPHFVSTTKFAPRVPDDEWSDLAYAAWDCRHGLVLLGDRCRSPMGFVVWDPMTGCRWELDVPTGYMSTKQRGAAAVLCSMAGCDHRVCHEGCFRVVFISLDPKNGVGVARAGIFSMEKGGVSKPCSPLHLDDGATIDQMPSVLVQDALHFMVRQPQPYVARAILKYDLGFDSLSLIHVPPELTTTVGSTILMAMEDGSLGIAGITHEDKFILHLWSKQMGSDGVEAWTHRRAVDLKEFLPIQNTKKRVIRLIGSMEGSDIIFVTTDLGIYEINLKSLRWKKLLKRERFRALIPYVSFCNPQERVSTSDAAH
uniref:F-box domain-containing protein n=3 Tax=Triticinae TaxID=1648030 RepID=A0A453MIL1_AEGTS